MNLQSLLLILRARYRLILLVLCVTVMATLTVSLLLPKQYVAASAVVVDVKSPDPIVGAYLPALSMPGYMATQVDVLNSDRVAQKVVGMTKLDQDPKIKAQWQAATSGKGRIETWLAEKLQRGLDVKPSRESNVINIIYRAPEPATAALVANAYAQAYIDTTVELRVEPARQYARWFEGQGKVLRENLDSAEKKLSDYQQRKGIVASDERLDSETAKLNELSSQLTVVQGQTSDAQSKQRSGGASGSLPEVSQNSLIMNLKIDIARLEARLQDVGGNLGKNHPQYQRMQSELEELKKRLASETRNITSGFSASRAVGRDKEAELRGAIERQKKKLLETKRQRGELGALQRDVDAAQKALDAVAQRFNQAKLESQSTQANVAVLTTAFEPIRHASPRITLNTLASILLGALLGIGAALLLEFRDRRVRSVQDIAELLQLPMLAVISANARRAKLNHRTAQVTAAPLVAAVR